MESIDQIGETEDIIPGLPNDLALRCLAKISHGHHGLLESVSKKWRNAVKSSDYANLKAKEGWCGNWQFVSTRIEHKCHWDAYDPDADRWHPLPSLPGSNYGNLDGCSCVIVCKSFLMIGGSYLAPCKSSVGINDVNMFDPYKQQWSRMCSMKNARANFACAAIGDKVYVAGGSTPTATGGLLAAEVYDPYMDRWEDLPPMPFSLVNCFSLSYGSQFHVVGKREISSEFDTYLVFSPEGQKWCIVEDEWPFSKLARECTTVAHGHIYTVLDDGSVNILDTDSKNWRKLGLSPLIVLPNHVRPLKLFGFSLVGFKENLYVVGGMALKYDSNDHAYDVVEVNTVKFCDPKSTPLKWQDVRAMPGPSSGVIGCALVED